MHFIDALTVAVAKSGWTNSPNGEFNGQIRFEVQNERDRSQRGHIAVSSDSVRESWNKWPEEEQVRGREKLEQSIPRVLQQFARMSGLQFMIDATYWTPKSGS
jgi:hypothetical protein